MKKELFRGSAAALITPFTPDGRDVDYAMFQRLIEFQLQNETDALVIAGTTGESPVLSSVEKEKMFGLAVCLADKRIPVIAGTGANDTQTAVRRSNEAEKKGVDGLLIVTPFYNKCTQEGLIRHYHYIADRVSAPIIVYNVPSRTGVNILPETYKEIVSHRNIVGIKEANGDLSAASKTAALCGRQAALYSGNDDQTLAFSAVGGDGVISVAANIIPREMHRMTSLSFRNRFDEARLLQRKYDKLTELLFCEVNPIPVKYAVELLTRVPQTLRLPLTRLSEAKMVLLEKEMRRLHLLGN